MTKVTNVTVLGFRGDLKIKFIQRRNNFEVETKIFQFESYFRSNRVKKILTVVNQNKPEFTEVSNSDQVIFIPSKCIG